MNPNLEKLKKQYKNDNVVPFVGAGLSIPFKIPDWGELIQIITDNNVTANTMMFKDLIMHDLSNNDFWSAVDHLKKYLNCTEEDLQEEICEIIESKLELIIDEQKHNYSDLSNMNLKLFLTTNYDNLLHKYLNFNDVPVCLTDVNFNTQTLLNKERVLHLHGMTSNNGSIVLSEEKYKSLYSSEKYKDLLKLVTGSKSLLFIGFSFDDQFLMRLIEDHKASYKGIHYILLPNPEPERIKRLNENYRLKVVSYNPEKSSHAEEIRKILKYLSENNGDEQDDNVVDSEIVIGAGKSSYKKIKKDNLFYKKLQIEDIDTFMIELCSNFYIAAEEYIRELKNKGFPIKYIDTVLGLVMMEYKEKYVSVYRRYGDSSEFLNVVHESLSNIDLGRYKDLINKNVSNKYENQGFIHVLADDEGEDIWWGKERIDND